MILFSKQHFNKRRIAVIVCSDFKVYFKLVEVIRLLFNMCDHTYIHENYIRVFDEFPNTKFVSAAGLRVLTGLSPKTATAQQLQHWADSLFLR
ncbi:hypothetical protein [Erinnyis ello granulovirus]|uniref:Uncharacterized protein n=1 Tax=Erinnyis ello granulovirus TaxID=307444 RepID=A0A097DAR7_9BBAC|nr:hypothetical protein [Erinnyis ello granulovirus]AIS92116.1 hypothetical protein [Erinnyis ello granulovirus]ARX71457.1 hypothetical protein EREL_118 [Erinnyis ello granulovirus]ARX71587.1 hypothetical protein EREL_118 [Erinnyis ello granulovirus]ARX71717.1 hypothetical protein EREL_118 [Erinnyis ello granulovirus]ARX71847.1 hypothetical protein EREL_118 [Erinnyis ello granulovirus]